MTSLSKKARIAGLLYLLASLVGVVSVIYMPSVLVVSGDASATAANLLAHESLFRWGMLCQMLVATGWIFVTLALYQLLKDVDQGLAVVMVILGSLIPAPIFCLN